MSKRILHATVGKLLDGYVTVCSRKAALWKRLFLKIGDGVWSFSESHTCSGSAVVACKTTLRQRLRTTLLTTAMLFGHASWLPNNHCLVDCEESTLLRTLMRFSGR